MEEPHHVKRKLTAILSADVKGYSRLMGEDDAATVPTLTSYREVMGSLIQQHEGRVVDSPGDNLLAEFISVVDAVQCAVAIQKELKAKNAELPPNRQMEYRIGVNLGDVICEHKVDSRTWDIMVGETGSIDEDSLFTWLGLNPGWS
jgi:adenylate cyclase